MEEKKLEKNIHNILISHIKDYNKIKRNNLIIKIIIFMLFCVFFININTEYNTNYHTAIIKIEGEISASSPANAKDILKSVNKAYSNKYTEGIILEINSPGGSPVQSQLVYKELRRLNKKYPKIPIYSVIKDIGASAAYLIACGTNKIYADEMSIIGSIGVLISTFGFEDLIKKLGIERRLYTSGKFKGLMDPFSKINSDQKKIINYQLKAMHKIFIKNVLNGRKDKIKITPLVFSGLTWVGSDAFNIGLIDGFGNINSVSREIIKSKYIIDYTSDRSFFINIKEKVNAILYKNYIL